MRASSPYRCISCREEGIKGRREAQGERLEMEIKHVSSQTGRAQATPRGGRLEGNGRRDGGGESGRARGGA